ncbi:hypothetical protein [Methylobacterium sp. J-070]|uniref:hypothetical protein n=1 Tax=Methylobacterium sp. J-070 TaxID=2836650 RepID=UPI001FB947C7|nr:hypothetical protein [Methylobacterium sp. J-070]MCJ2048534.1 hypothetical protein [Methylobacterium sp. J-070]
MIVEELIGRISLQTKGIDDAKKAVKVLAEFRKALKGLADGARGRFDGPGRLARGLRDAVQAQKKLASGGDMGRADKGVKQQVSTVKRLADAYRDAAKAQAALSHGPRTSGRSWISGELEALRRYKREMKAVEREAGRRGVPRNRVGQMSRVPYGERHPIGEAIGGGVLGAGAARGSQYAVAQGANVLQESNRERNAGMEAAQIAALDKRAMELSAEFPSVDATTIRSMGRDARNMFPNFDKAMEALPDLVKARVMLQAAKGKEAADNELQDFLKGEDIRGDTEDVGKFRTNLNNAIKAVQVEGGQLPLREYKQFAKMSKAGGGNLSDEFMAAVAPTFMQSEGGARFGTQIAAGIASLISGRRTKKSTAALGELGLLDKKGKLKNAAKYQENPHKYATEDMMPALQRKGVDINDDKAVQAYMARIFSSAITENLFTKMITQRDQVARNIKTYKGSTGLEGAKGQTRGDPYIGFEGLVAQIKNFLGVTQSENVASATKGLASITEAIGDFNKKLSNDPATAQAVGVGEAGAAAAVGGWGIYKFISGARKVLGLGGEAAKAGGAEAAVEGAKVGPQASALDTAGRAITRGAAAAAFPVTAGLTKGDQNKLIERAVRVIQDKQEASAEVERETRRGRAMSAAPNIPTLPGGPSSGLPRMLQDPKAQFGAVEQRLKEMQTNSQKVIDTLDQNVKLQLDYSAIDAAQGRAEKLMATLNAAKGAAASIGSGTSGNGAVSLYKGSNTFSTGVTAP